MKKIYTFLFIVCAFCTQLSAQISITCAEARTNALSVSADNELYNGGATYVARGYVTAIQTAWSSSWKNVSFWIADTQNGGKIIQAFRCEAQTQAEAPNVGALVDVTGQLTKYGSTPEFAAGCTCSIVESADPPVNLGYKTIDEFITEANTKDTSILVGVVTNIVSSQYGNLYIEDATGSIYVYGIKNYSNYDIAVNDTLTIAGVYKYFNEHEVANAIYIYNAKYVEPTPDPGPQPEGIDFETAFANGWSQWIGQTVTFSNDFVYCDTYNNTIAPHRLRNAEEYGEEGSTAYLAALAKNTNDSCKLFNFTIDWRTYRTGTLIRGLEAYIPAANQLQAVNTPQLINHELPTERPDLGNPDLVICGSNVENFFVTLGGYAGASSEAELEVQKTKISKALHNMDADIYALCEVEEGSAAPQTLVDLLNNLAGSVQYDFVNAGAPTYQSGMVCYLYRKTKVRPFGNYIFPCYYQGAMKWREAIQGFEEIATGEKFSISMNHFYAKITKTDADREDNMNKLITALYQAEYNDPDVLVMGDLNAYSGERSMTMLCPDYGYVDLLMKYDPDGYSHLFGGTAGFLDHAYCSPSMESQVTKAVSYHLNADSPKSIYGYTTGNESMYHYSDHDPILVGLKLSSSAEGVEEVNANASAVKTIRHGQLIIIRSGVEYTVTGQRAR